jgi:hypothetical protein
MKDRKVKSMPKGQSTRDPLPLSLRPFCLLITLGLWRRNYSSTNYFRCLIIHLIIVLCYTATSCTSVGSMVTYRVHPTPEIANHLLKNIL